MNILSKLKVVEYIKETNSNPITQRRKKLIAKIDEQIILSQDANYTVTRSKWVRDADGDKKVDVARSVKRWWHTNTAGNVILTIRYGSKPVELADGKCGIELGSESELADTLALIKNAVDAGELDDNIAKAVAVKSSDKRLNQARKSQSKTGK
jgi:hypothetical protein